MVNIKNWLKLNNIVLNINRRNVEYIYTWNYRRYFEIADDKCLTKKVLAESGIPVPETYAVIEAMGKIEEAWSKIRSKSCFAIKPSRGRAGSGIIVLEKHGEQWYTSSNQPLDEKQIKNRIADIIFGNYSFGLSDKALVEERIKPHKFFLDIFPQGICDIRVITFRGRTVMAMCRIPTSKSDGKANLHQGALGVAVDLSTGQLGHGYDYRSYMESHPDTGSRFYGRLIPEWKEIMTICEKVSEHLPLKYLGIDIVIDSFKGPLVMEANIRPGLEIQNVNRKGLIESL